jgi:Protein of unknown function (DUF3365)
VKLALAAALLLAAPEFAPSKAPAALRSAVVRADEAIRSAACSAERRFGEGDPDANAARCANLQDPAGVRVGRTSARLRNPRNAPPAWARAYVEANEGKKARAVRPIAFDLGDRVGLLRPIEIRKRCLACHAAREQIEPGTREWLEAAYPEDRSFGYALGDLRGFWWAEAKKAP